MTKFESTFFNIKCYAFTIELIIYNNNDKRC